MNNHNQCTISPNSPHHMYSSNTLGRDLICGDIHGCYDQLMHALKLLNFDQAADRLFSVGDLIDRGPKSMECANLIYEPWFHATQGNHEELMFMSLLQNSIQHQQTWLMNGGLWYKEEDPQLLYDIAKRFQQLPLIITIGNGENRFNIVHAELIRYSIKHHKHIGVTNENIDKWEFDKFAIHDMLWGRHLINTRTKPDSYKLIDMDLKEKYHSEDNLSLTYVGHSIVPHRPVRIEQHVYIDTGCVGFTRNPHNINTTLTIASPNEQTFYIYQPGWKTLVKYPYKQLKKYT